MLIMFCMSGSAACVPVMAAKGVCETENINPADNKTKDIDQQKNNSESIPRKKPEAFEVDFGEPMPPNYNANLQEAFKKFRKQRQDDIKQSRRLLLKQHKEKACDPRRMETLRTKFMDQAKRYFGVPYARKYWSKDSPEYNSPKFLDCCGLIRQVMRDLEEDFGFRIGPWNQAYMYDTLPISRDISQMRPGDLVFMSGVYTSKKNRKQRHNMTHVEIWLGEGEKTIGARWNNGKVQVFDSYKFSPKSFTNEQYYFRSLDTWLMGICKSFCGQHKWGRSSHALGKKSIFFTEQNLPLQDEKAGDDDDDDSDDESQSTKQDTATAATPAAATDNRDDEKSASSNSTKSDSPEFCDKDDDDSQERLGSEKKRKKKRRRKCRKVSKKALLPRATKRALLVLEEHIDSIIAKKEVPGSALSPSQPPLKPTPRTRHVSVRRPVTSAQEDAGTAWTSHSSSVGKSSSKIGIRPRVWCPLVGSSSSQQAQYIPSKMPQRESGPLTVGRTVPVDPRELDQTFWLPVGRVNPMDRGALTDRMTVARGLLAVIGSGRAPSLKKNRSCGDLVTVGGQPMKIKEAGSQAWRHSLPETLKAICSPRLTFRPEFASPERDDSWTETPSAAAGYISDEEDSEDNDETSLACNSDCCASAAEDLDLDLDDICDGNDIYADEDSPRWPSDETHGALACRRRLESFSDSEQSFPTNSRSWATQAASRSQNFVVLDAVAPILDDDDNDGLARCSEKTAIGDDHHHFFLPAVGRDQQLSVRGAAPVSSIATAEPQDGDGKTEGGADGQGASGASGDPQDSEQAAGDEAGGEAGGDGGGRGSGRRGDKKTPGGRQARLPFYSLPSNMTPTFYISGGNGTALVEGPLLAMGWKRTLDKNDERFRLKWVECKSKINYTVFKEGEQLVNHIPNCKLLTNKLGLLCSLQEYERVTLSTKGRPPRLKMSEFVPETYKLDERNDRTAFLENYKDGEIWICKPIGMNQGKGIFLLRSKEEIDNLLTERDAKKDSMKLSSKPPMVRIVQRYIVNPLLLDGRKFDIRAYMLIASTVPYLVLFHHGYIRLSCQKYDGNDTNLTTHLTNQYVQKKDPTYKDVKEDTAWNMDKFNAYINSHYSAESGIEENWTFSALTKQMQKITLHIFNSVKHKLQCKMGYFDLYGLDFMIDTNMKVWLIEVNVNPALNINCEALKEVIPGVVEETLHLAIECFDKSRKNQPLLPLQSLKGFSILHCGTQGYTVPRQTRSVSPAKGDNAERTRPFQTAYARNYSPPRSLPRMSLTTTQVSPYLVPIIPCSTVRRMPTSLLPIISQSTTSPINVASSSTNSGDDVRLKMTHANSSSLRKSKEKADRGN